MQKVQLLDKTCDIQLSENIRKSSFKWAAFNLCVISIVFYDIKASSKYYRENDFFYYAECFACLISILSFLTNVVRFISHSCFSEKVVCENEMQRVLLNLNSSNSIVKSTPLKTQPALGKQNESIKIQSLSFQNYNDMNSTMNSPQHQNNSWMSNASGQMRDSSFNQNLTDPSNFQTPPKFNNSELIMNRGKMDQYLKNVAQNEKDIASAIEAQNNVFGHMGSTFSSFWGNCRSDEIIASLKSSLYQLSPQSTKQSSRDETYSNKDQENNSEIIREMCANKLSKYTANLKLWISKTILEPLITAIDEVDKAFQQRGFTDMKIGSVGLERLKKMASSNPHLVQHIPMLPKVIPFLELTTNQEFMVQRIRELAKGSFMNNYQFKTFSFNQPDQNNDHIPSDAGIIFHLFCTYLDTQLYPLPDIPRAFYSRYVVLGDVKKSSVENIVKEVNKNNAKCGFLCSNPITPKFNFISDTQVHTSSYDRNNLFYVIIQFLMHLKRDGTLESVSLGKSGVNILNIIDG